MKILLIAAKFPPYQSIGALRASKLAQYWIEKGHEVRVLAMKNPPIPIGLELEIDPGLVTYTNWFNVNFLPELFFGGREKVVNSGYKTRSTGLKSLGFLYRTLFNYPDELAGWLPYAVRNGDVLIRQWKPDLIYASGMPYTSFMVAARLSQKHTIPWMAELRDPWVDSYLYPYPAWRRKREEKLEKATLSSACGLVTVSQPLADVLVKNYTKPVAVVMNGFDPEDYPHPETLNPPDPDLLRIVYTGGIYPGYRDPTPLFAALRQMGPLAEKVRVQFFTRYLDWVLTQARNLSIEHLVEGKPLIPYRESLKTQMEADVLLMLLWNDPAEQGVLSRKLFEYFGARRPILAIGLGHDIAAGLVRERQAGLVSNNADEIAAQIASWLKQKAVKGMIAPPPPEARRGLSRREQFDILDCFLKQHISIRDIPNSSNSFPSGRRTKGGR